MEKSLLYRNQNFTQTDVDEIVTFIETLNEKPTLLRKISFLTVETLQNIIHHSDKTEDGNTLSYFELLKEDNEYTIKTGNLISKENTDKLEKRLDYVTHLTEEEVKEKITNSLKNDNFSEKGGGNIGLLSIKKRTGDGMSYKIEIFKDNFNFIHFEIKI